MKIPLSIPARSALFFAFVVGSGLSLSELTARADDYGFGNYFGSGTGTWENGGGTPWGDFQTNTDNLPWDNSLQNDAIFYNPVDDTVIGDVSTNYLLFINNNNSYVLQGGTITKNANNSQGGLILQNVGANDNVTIDSNLLIDTAGGTDRFNIVGYGANSTTDIEGSVGFFDSTVDGPSYRSLIFNANAPNETFILNGANTTGTAKAINIRFSEGSYAGTLVLKGDYSTVGDGAGDWLEVPEGTVILDTSLINTSKSINTYNGSNNVADPHVVLTEGAQTIGSYVNAQDLDYTNHIDGTVTVGGSTADVSSYTGGIGMSGSGLDLTAYAGGRVNVNTISGGSELGVTKTGAGTVVLYGNNSYGLNPYFGGAAGTVAMDIQQGTLLINTPLAGTSFGSGAGSVNIEAGATFGGNGATSGTQLTKAMAATAVIAPGDAGQANLGIAPSIGTLDLQGGLEADNGLVMDFKLTGELDGTQINNSFIPVPGPEAGVDNDFLEVSSFTLGGKVTVNLTALDALATGVYYTLFSDTNADAIDPASFDVIAPTGYALDSSYGGNGGNGGYDYTDGVLTVQLVETPEPSTWAMMFGGLVVLGFCIRRKMATVRA